MQVLPIDITGIVAIVMGMLVVLIPIAGVTARFALKPLVESFAHLFQDQRIQDTVAITERRVALLESQIESLEDQLRQVHDKQSFDRRLERSPDASGQLSHGTPSTE